MKKNVILSNVIFVIFVISVLFFLFSLIYSSIKTTSLQDLTEEEQLFKKSDKEFASLRDSMKDWDNVEGEYLKFKDKFILRFEDFSSFRNNLELLIRQNSLSKLKFGLEYKRALKNEYIKVKLNIRLKGTYANLKKFIFDIRKTDKIVYFTKIRISGSGALLTADFNLEVYLVR